MISREWNQVKAATELLQLQNKMCTRSSKTPRTAEEIAVALSADAEAVYHVLEHLCANDPAVKSESRLKIAKDKFFLM
jgi:hypothetical protein